MSRLYAWLSSDTRKGEVTRQGDERIEVAVNWGSRGNSMRAAWLSVVWEKGAERPTVHVRDYVGEVKSRDG